MQKPKASRAPSELRTLETLASNYADFVQKGHSNLKKAKSYRNVISRPYFQIPLVQVSGKLARVILQEYISLPVGVHSRPPHQPVFFLQTILFEDAAHQLDVLIATGLGHSRSSTQLQDGTQFRRHIEAMQTVSTLTEKKNEFEDEAEFYESLLTWTTLSGQDQDEDEDQEIAAMRREIEILKEKAAEMVNV